MQFAWESGDEVAKGTKGLEVRCIEEYDGSGVVETSKRMEVVCTVCRHGVGDGTCAMKSRDAT